MEINIQIRFIAENSSTSLHDFVCHELNVEEMYGKFARVDRQSFNHGCARL